jgi:Tol biopolymer transport system component
MDTDFRTGSVSRQAGRRTMALAAFASVVLGLVAVAGSAQGSDADRAKPKIAFGRWFPALDDYRLFTIKPDGSDERLLLGHSAETPVWSPDETKLLVTLTGLRGIGSATLNPDGSGFNQFGPPRSTLSLTCQAWSPDGIDVACAGYDPGGDPSRYGMYTIRASDGGDLLQLTTRPNGLSDDGQFVNDIPVGYSADGSWILFDRNRRSDVGILFAVRPDGTDLHRLTSKSLAVPCCRAAWSPHGSRVVFPAYLTEKHQLPSGLPQSALFVVNADGTGLHRITPSRPGARNAQWSPTGRLIAFNSPLLSGAQVYVVRPSGTGLRKVTSPTNGYVSFAPVWSPGGAKLAFTSCSPDVKRGQLDLWIMNPNGTGLRQLTSTPEPHFDFQPAWGTGASNTTSANICAEPQDF